jgi:hypothetical protein
MRSTGFRSRRRGWGVTLAVAGSVVMGILVGGALPASAASTPYNSNLVQNAGAENGLGHWDTFPSGDFKTHKYGPAGHGYPSKQTGNAINGGTYFFDGGPYDNVYGTCGDAQQQWTLQGIGSAIDGGHVKVTLKGYAGTNGASGLHAHLDLYFRNSQNHSVSSNGITRTAGSTNEKYKLLKGSATLPVHTRILRVHLWTDGSATETSGACQAFWDNISVVLTHS